METLAYVRKDQRDVYDKMANFFGHLFLINFSVGVVTGIVQEFQFGMNWSELLPFVGNIFGVPLALEVLMAFFLESTFIGAGKSTVLALALPSRDPDSGRVTLGGTDLCRVALPEVRRRSAWEPQVPQLLGGTLAGNLRIARPGATDVELEAALREVELDTLLVTVGLHGWIGRTVVLVSHDAQVLDSRWRVVELGVPT